MKTTVKAFHNPDELKPTTIGVDAGWRLLRKKEKPQRSDQVWIPFSSWEVTSNGKLGLEMDSICTYRTRRPL